MKGNSLFTSVIYIIIALVFVAMVVSLTSCSKEQELQSPEDVGRTYVRIQEVDNDGHTMYSNITVVNVTK